MGSHWHGILRHLPLTWKMVGITLGLAGLLWLLLDQFHTHNLELTLRRAALEELERDAQVNRGHLHMLVEGIVNEAAAYELIFTANRLLEGYPATPPPPRPRAHTPAQPPSWLKGRTPTPQAIHPETVVLLDPLWRPREYYHAGDLPPPPPILGPDRLLQIQSRGQALLTTVEELPYLVTTRTVPAAAGGEAGHLLAATPIDARFLTRLSSALPHGGSLLALLAGDGVSFRVVSSSDPERVPTGTRMVDLASRYFASPPLRLDYGAADILLYSTTLVPRQELNRLIRKISREDRLYHLATALALVGGSVLLMTLLTRRINRLKSRLAEQFRYQDSPGEQELPRRGDELWLLEERFAALTARVRQGEEALQESHRQLRTILDGLEAMVLVVDQRSGEVIFVNAYTLRECGDVTRISCQEFCQLDGRPDCPICDDQRLRGAREEPSAGYRWEYRSRRTGRWYAVNDRAIRWTDGRWVGLEIAVDITASKRAQEELQRRQEELAHAQRLNTAGELISGMAHELNQPLAAILNYARGALRRLDGGELPLHSLVEVLQRISEQAERIDQVVRNLRQFLRKGESHPRPLPLDRVWAGVLHLADFTLRQVGVAVRVEIPSPAPVVLADPVQLEQVLLNLLTNGVEALSQEPSSGIRQIVVTAAPGEGLVACTIADNGPGVEPGREEAIFDPFFTSKPDGMGLGLSISRSLIERHGGTLTLVAGTTPGAAFRLTLPSAEEET